MWDKISAVNPQANDSVESYDDHNDESESAETFNVAKSCDCCESMFIRTSDLRRHQQKRENQDGLAKFSFTLCVEKMCNEADANSDEKLA